MCVLIFTLSHVLVLYPCKVLYVCVCRARRRRGGEEKRRRRRGRARVCDIIALLFNE
jgi:hypothetical protein